MSTDRPTIELPRPLVWLAKYAVGVLVVNVISSTASAEGGLRETSETQILDSRHARMLPAANYVASSFPSDAPPSNPIQPDETTDRATNAGWPAFQRTAEGNLRFIEGRATHENQQPARRTELSSGQHPHTIVLSCSDSRVPPELVFDQGLGEVFTVRSAGGVADTSAIASIEYAVVHLGAKLIIVMGHESCGAVQATLSTAEGTSAGSPNLDQLVAMIRPNLTGVENSGTDPTLREPVKRQVEGVAKQLTEKSEILNSRSAGNQLLIAKGVYNLSTGKVDFWF